jgi:hypothetical protein
MTRTGTAERSHKGKGQVGLPIKVVSLAKEEEIC